MTRTLTLAPAHGATANGAATLHRLYRLAIAKAAAAFSAWAAWRKMRRDMNLLYAMDDRMLADIGLSRSEIGYVVRIGRIRD